MTEQELLQTPLHDLHLELGGKMVGFAGYSMPVQYPEGIKQEHLHTRDNAGLFDVSHMGQLIIRGEGVATALEKLIPVDLEALAVNQQTYAVLTNAEGGIMDDLIVTRWSEHEYFLVVNAACKDQDIAHLKAHLDGFEFEILSDRALLALQGPRAHEVIGALAPEVLSLIFMQGCHASLGGSDCYVTRSGYTGEDGFEISTAKQDAATVAKILLEFSPVKAIGLGARDSLRLEAGLCLYGHDMNPETSPIEAGLIWSISKSRRVDGTKAGGFLGSKAILEHIANGVLRKRVGFLVDGKAPVREGAEIINENGEVIGEITSGGFGPSINTPVAMGYVPIEYIKAGTRLRALVRGKAREITVTKTPFVAQRYHRG